jgi:hypothetical protein
MFAYPCPSCRQRLLAPPARAGHRSICPKCLQPLTVPHPEQVAAGPFAPPDPSPAELFSPADDLIPLEVDAALDTPQPMNTLPAVGGMHVASGQGATPTEPFLDLEPVPVELPSITPAPLAAPAPFAGRRGPPPTPRPFLRDQEGKVVLAPTGLFAVDVAAELSAAISMRMAPPPIPTSDRTYAVAGWAVGTLVGLGAWVMGVWVSAAWLPYVALVGGAMVAFGFLWRAYLSGRDGAWGHGLVTLLPPVGLVQLFRPVSGYGRKPLLFAITGGVLCGLFAVGGPAKRWFDERFETQVVPTTSTVPVTTADTAVERLSDKAERDAAKAVLVRLGPAAEPAVRKVLTGNGDATTLAACDVLEQIGTAESVTALRKLADETTSKAVRLEATSAAEAIEKRLAGGR